MRAIACWLACGATSVVLSQFPLVRSLEVRPGQERPSIRRIAQDPRGMIWTASDAGLFRTDGDQVEAMLRTDGDPVLAIAVDGKDLVAGTALGYLLRINDAGLDTLSADTSLRAAPISSLATAKDGDIWIGSYGHGLGHWRQGTITWIDVVDGLPDDHVNDLDLLPDGRVVVATDQGLALCANGRVTAVMGEAQGAPDNLTLCVHALEHAAWVGTDRAGVFLWKLEQDPSSVMRTMDGDWSFGPVNRVCGVSGMVWAGTKSHGPIVIDLGLLHGTYGQGRSTDPEVLDLMTGTDGAVWWCDGSEMLHRADPAILFVPEHEGLDLRHITALCADGTGRIWFATADGLFEHVAYFSEERKVHRTTVEVGPQGRIVSLAADEDGTIWAGTFGKGVIAVDKNGSVRTYTKADGLANDNVLAVRRGKGEMLFVTLEGISAFDGHAFHAAAPEVGFVFDVQARDAGLVIATDGAGLKLVPPGPGEAQNDHRTFYTLVPTEDGSIWAAGPGTGFCRTGGCDSCCVGRQAPPFDGDLFAVGTAGGKLIAFGSTGVLAFDPRDGSLNDVTAAFGLDAITAELNVVSTDPSGALWFGCSKGLVRLRPHPAHFDQQLRASLLGLQLDGEQMPVSERVRAPHDRNTVSIRFTAPYFIDPGAVRFQYRMSGLDDRIIDTRDREVTFAALPPGDYVFQVRAFVGPDPGSAAWTELPVTIELPWWRRTWFITLAVIGGSVIAFLLLRLRERRVRYRDRLEKEKVRFQLDALRSQVDPHFLFNSFNALVELIETDPERAVDHVEQLSTFFRNILQVRDLERITVDEELGLLENYFALEQRRFGGNIGLHVQVDAEARQCAVVPLALQLLVENALKHNVVVGDGPFTIDVRSERDAIVVSNPLRPRSSPPRSTGFGLDSITTRYAALTDHPVTAEKKDGRFVVRIPLIDPLP